MREYSIYIIRNTVNNKVYIGQTSQSVKERFCQHKKPSTHKQRGTYKLYNAMKKYGKEKFYIETLETGIPENEIDQKEIEYIEKYDSYENGYNSTKGGDGKTISKIEDIREFEILYIGGTSEKRIAEKFNVAKITVKRTAEALGLPPRTNRVTKDYLMKNSHKTNSDMAMELNVDNYTITRAFKKYGIKRGKGYNNHLNKQNQPRIPDEEKEEFIAMWMNTDIKIADMAKYYNLNPRRISAYREKWNLPLKRDVKKIDMGDTL